MLIEPRGTGSPLNASQSKKTSVNGSVTPRKPIISRRKRNERMYMPAPSSAFGRPLGNGAGSKNGFKKR